MLNKLTCFSRSQWYWLLLLLAGISMEAVALFYQYQLQYDPCVLCIHVRIWVAALIIIACLGLTGVKIGCGKLRALAHIGTIAVAVGMFERSWKTLGVERGWIIESCSMDSGLPDWFALDQWFPALFKPWEPCGYTPELLFKITMAEGLVAFSGALIIASVVFALLQLRKSGH